MREYKTRKGNKRAQLCLGFEPPGDRADRGRASAAPRGAGIPVERETEMEVARKFRLGGIEIDAYLHNGAWWVRPVAVANSLGLNPRGQRRVIDRSDTGEAVYVTGYDAVGVVRPLRVLRLGDLFQWILKMEPGRMDEASEAAVRRLQADLKELLDQTLPSALALSSDGVAEARMTSSPDRRPTSALRSVPGRKWWNLFGGKSNG